MSICVRVHYLIKLLIAVVAMLRPENQLGEIEPIPCGQHSNNNKKTTSLNIIIEDAQRTTRLLHLR